MKIKAWSTVFHYLCILNFVYHLSQIFFGKIKDIKKTHLDKRHFNFKKEEKNHSALINDNYKKNCIMEKFSIQNS